MDFIVSKDQAQYPDDTGKDRGINPVLLQTEAIEATGFPNINVFTNATDITFDIDAVIDAADIPRILAQLTNVVQLHDGRQKGGRGRRQEDGAQLVTLAKPSFIGIPRHQSSAFSTGGNLITIADIKLPDACDILSADFWVGPTALFGDRLRVEFVDIDGVLETPAGTVLDVPVPGMFIPPGGTGPNPKRVSSGQAFAVPAGLYFRFTYTTTGTVNVDIIASWDEIYKTAPTSNA